MLLMAMPMQMQASEGSGAKVCEQSGLIDTSQVAKPTIAQLLAEGIGCVKLSALAALSCPESMVMSPYLGMINLQQLHIVETHFCGLQTFLRLGRVTSSLVWCFDSQCNEGA